MNSDSEKRWRLLREGKHLFTPQEESGPPKTRTVFLIWSAVVIGSFLITIGGVASGQLMILALCWPACPVAALFTPKTYAATPAEMFLSFVWSLVVYLAYYSFLHVGLLLAMWKWQARWLLLEVAMLAAVVGTFSMAARSDLL